MRLTAIISLAFAATFLAWSRARASETDAVVGAPVGMIDVDAPPPVFPALSEIESAEMVDGVRSGAAVGMGQAAGDSLPEGDPRIALPVTDALSESGTQGVAITPGARFGDVVVPYEPAPCRTGRDDSLFWLDGLRVGYDEGFVIASTKNRNLQESNMPFRLQLNGWGQLRHTLSDYSGRARDLNQFQLKRGRLVFSGGAFNPNFSYFIQLDGRSSSGDDMRLLDYYLSYDFGKQLFRWQRGAIGFRTGKYKMPFNLARWVTGRQFEFTDRSVSSMFFDVNRSFAWGLYGQSRRLCFPVYWETSIFNGLVTGGAETGSSGTLDDNFAYSGRIFAHPIGDWGDAELADLECHRHLATRIGCGFARTSIDRTGSTEFGVLRVVDSGATLSSLLPNSVVSYDVTLFSADMSFKWRGWSSTFEYYYRRVSNFVDIAAAPMLDLNDHGFWFQLGYFIVPQRLQCITRWSRVVGNSGTAGTVNQSSDELAVGLAWHFRRNHSKAVIDLTQVNGAPINSSSLDISPGNDGLLLRSQIQFSF